MIQYPLHEKEEKAEQNIKKTSAYIEMELFDLTFGNTKKASEVYDGWTDDRTGKKKLGTDRKIGFDCYSVAFLVFTRTTS